MIIFFEKKTGRITGTIDGRIHPEGHLNMWIGDKKETDRLVVEWKPVNKGDKIVEKDVIIGYKKDKEGFDEPIIGRIKQKLKDIVYEPDSQQKELFIEIDAKKSNVYKYKVNLKTKELKKK